MYYKFYLDSKTIDTFRLNRLELYAELELLLIMLDFIL